MPTKIYEIDLDIKNPEFKLVSPIEVVSGDTDTNIFNIQLFENFVPVNASGNTVVIIFGKPDNTTVFQNLTVVDAIKGQYTCTLSSQTIAVPGRIKAEVALYEGIKRLTSTRFEFIVRKALLDENTVESSNEFSALTEALSTVNQYDNRITDLAGTGRTTETVKGNADAQAAHEADTTNYAEFIFTTNQSIANSTPTQIVFNYTTKANAELFELLSSGKIKILKAGTYEIELLATFASNASGWRRINTFTRQMSVAPVSGVATGLYLAEICVFDKDYEVAPTVTQTSGGALDLLAGYIETSLQIRKVG